MKLHVYIEENLDCLGQTFFKNWKINREEGCPTYASTEIDETIFVT
jgi:hypothetical protein